MAAHFEVELNLAPAVKPAKVPVDAAHPTSSCAYVVVDLSPR
jgi:hypothetical protein